MTNLGRDCTMPPISPKSTISSGRIRTKHGEEVGLLIRFRSVLRCLCAVVMAAATTLTMAVTGTAVTAGSAGASAPAPGYWVIGALGGVWNFGSAPPLGSIAGVTAPLVAAAATPSGHGLWLAGSDGHIYTLGDAVSHGDLAGFHLNKPVVGMSATADGGGYWMVAGDGGIFTFGDATFMGSLGSYRLNKPVVAMATTPGGGGYWMVASDGGIFTFGNAHFFGSEGSLHLNQPVIGMSPTADGGGYWLVATDGGVFTHGDAPFEGSLGSYHLNKPIMSMTPTSDNRGYWLIGADGGVFTFGDAPFVGSLGSTPPSQKVVFLAPLPPGSSVSPSPTPVNSPPPPPPPSPISTVSAPAIAAVVGQTWSGTVATFQDPNAGAAVQGSPVINWGDGHTSFGTVSGSGGAWTVSGSHAWTTGGTFPVSVSISDNAGAQGSASGSANVTGLITGGHPDPTVSGLNEGTAVPVNTLVGVFTDNNTNATAPNLTATIDWRDVDLPNPDQLTTGTVQPVSQSNAGLCPNSTSPCYQVLAQAPNTSNTYIYGDEGQYHPTVTISESGAAGQPISGAFTNTIDVLEGTDASFTTATGPLTMTHGQTGSMQPLATFIDATSLHDDYTSPFLFTVDWGDGTSCSYRWNDPTTTFSFATTSSTDTLACGTLGLSGHANNGGIDLNGAHNYATPGPEMITITSFTENGYSGAWPFNPSATTIPVTVG
jgi:hypothetical protein